MQKFTKVLLIAVGMISMSLQAEKEKNGQHKSKESESCCAPTLITQKCVDKVEKTYTITQSGLYAFAEDITGLIEVQADNVCIDLCCHTLTGNVDNRAALNGNGFRGLEVFNGFIEHDGHRGLQLLDYEGFSLHDLSFYPVNDAIGLFNSSHGVLRNIKANGNTISNPLSAAMIFIGAGGSDFELTDIEVSHCISTVNLGRMLFINGCDNVRMTRVHINNNLQNVQDASFFAPLHITGVLSLEADDCEVNDNQVITPTVEFDNVRTSFSRNLIFRNCRFNNARAASMFFMEGFAAFVIQGLVLEGCQANGTRADFSQTTNFFTGAVGILVQESFECKIARCQANGTTHGVNQGSSIGFLNSPWGIGLLSSTDSIIEESQANFTTIESVDPGSTGQHNVAIGVAVVASSRCIIRKTEADFTSGGGEEESLAADGAFGIALLAGTTETAVIESSGSSSSAGKFSAGIIAHSFVDLACQNVLITKCVAHRNSAFDDSVPGKGYGIVLESVTNGTVSFCETNQNQTAGELYGPITEFVQNFPLLGSTAKAATAQQGGKVDQNNDVSTNKNIIVEGNSAQENGIGYLFDPTTKNICYYVHDNIAQGNTTSGFEQQGKFFGYWVSNYAACNGQDYFVESPIQLFAKSPKAIFKHRSGDKCLVGLANISIGTGK